MKNEKREMAGKKSNSKIALVEPLHKGEKVQITNLGERILDIINEYYDQQTASGQMVTVAELIGTLDLLKDRIKNNQ